MRVTIDKAGRLVIPKSLRDDVGITVGEVDVVRDGAGIRIEAVSTDDLIEVGGLLFIPAGFERVDDDLVRRLRDADQR